MSIRQKIKLKNGTKIVIQNLLDLKKKTRLMVATQGTPSGASRFPRPPPRLVQEFIRTGTVVFLVYERFKKENNKRVNGELVVMDREKRVPLQQQIYL